MIKKYETNDAGEDHELENIWVPEHEVDHDWQKFPEGQFTSMPKINVEIDIADNVMIHGYKTGGYNWLQRKMMRWCFGWEVRNVEERT